MRFFEIVIGVIVIIIGCSLTATGVIVLRKLIDNLIEAFRIIFIEPNGLNIGYAMGYAIGIVIMVALMLWGGHNLWEYVIGPLLRGEV